MTLVLGHMDVVEQDNETLQQVDVLFLFKLDR